jgi:hypothetical protein
MAISLTRILGLNINTINQKEKIFHQRIGTVGGLHD